MCQHAELTGKPDRSPHKRQAVWRDSIDSIYRTAPESATASAPTGKRSLPVASFAANHTASATSLSFVVSAGRANSAKIGAAKPANPTSTLVPKGRDEKGLKYPMEWADVATPDIVECHCCMVAIWCECQNSSGIIVTDCNSHVQRRTRTTFTNRSNRAVPPANPPAYRIPL